MATYTQNYSLHQWEEDDDFLRTDFNEDFAKIDTAIKTVEDDMTTAIATKSEVVIGTYTGTGTASRTIDLGFTPSAVLLEAYHGGRTGSSGAVAGLALPDCPLTYGFGTNLTVGLQIVDGGFWVSYVQYYSNTNLSGTSFYYIAFK